MAEARPKRPLSRRIARFFIGTGTLVGGLLAGAVGSLTLSILWLRTDTGNATLKVILLDQVANALTEGSLSVGEFHTDVLSHIDLGHVSLVDGAGNVVFAADRLDLRYNLWPIFTKTVHVNSVFAQGVHIDLVSDEKGILNIGRMFGQTEVSPPSDEPWGGLPVNFAAERAQIVGASFRYRVPGKDGAKDTDIHAAGINLLGQAKGKKKLIEASDLGVSATLISPMPLGIGARGGISYTGDGVGLDKLQVQTPGVIATVNGKVEGLESTMALDLDADITAVSMDRVRALMPKIAVHGNLGAKLKVIGPEDAIRVVGDIHGIQETPGTIAVDVTVNSVDSELPWGGSLGFTDVHVDEIYDTKGTGILVNGALTVKGHGTEWPAKIVVDGRFEGGPVVITQPGRVIRFEKAVGDLTLRNGVLGWSAVEVAGPLGVLHANGTLGLSDGELSTLVSGNVSLGGLEDLNIPDIRGSANVDAKVTGNVFAEDLPLAAKGKAIVSAFKYGKDVRFDRLNAGFAWSMRNNNMLVNADVVGTNGYTYGATMAQVAVPDVFVDMPAVGKRHITGTATVKTLAYNTTVSAGELEATFDVLQAPGEGPVVDASIDITDPVLMEQFRGDRGHAEIGVDDDVIAFDATLYDGDRIFVDAKGTYVGDRSLVSFERLTVAPTRRQQWKAVPGMNFVVSDGGLKDAHIDIASSLGHITLDGDVGTSGVLDADVHLTGAQLDAIAELFPEDYADLAGTVDLDLRITGRANDPVLEATFTAAGLWVPGAARWLDVSGRVGAVREQADIAVDVGVAGSPLARLDGVVPILLDLTGTPGIDADGSIDFDVALLPGPLERMEWLSTTELGLPAGTVSGLFTADGTLGDPELHGKGILELDVPGWEDRGRVEFGFDRVEDDLTWLADVRQGFSERARISGTAKTRLGEITQWALNDGPEPDFNDWTLYANDLNAKVAVLGMPVQSILALAGVDFVADADLMGGFIISGSPTTPVVSGALQSQGSIGGVELEGAYFALLPAEVGYTLDANVSFPEGGSIAIGGNVPIVVNLTEESAAWAKGDLDLTIAGDGVPLALVRTFVDGIGDAEGTVALNGTVKGSPYDPTPDLTAKIVDGLIEYRPQGVTFEHINAEASVDRRRVQIKQFDVDTRPSQNTFRLDTSARSKLSVRGSSRLSEWVPQGSNFTVSFDRAYLSATADQILQLSGDVDISGDWPKMTVDGDLAVDRGYLRYDGKGFGDTGKLTTADGLVIHRVASEVAAVEAKEAVPPIYADFNIDVGINLNRETEVDVQLPFVDSYGGIGALVSTANISARLDSENLRVTMKGGQLAVVHDVSIIEGQVAIFNALFDINSGSRLTFSGEPANPQLNLDGTMTLSQGDIKLSIRGNADEPSVTFASEAYPDQTDIFTILITGAAPEDLASTSGNDLVSQSAGMLLNNVLGSTNSQAFTVDPSGRIRLRAQIGRAVNATLSLDLLPEYSENGLEIGAEWQILQNIMAEGRYGDQRSGADVYWETHF